MQFYSKLLLLFSNVNKLHRESGKDTLTCLHGMRFISMSWVLLGHCFAFTPGTLGMNDGSQLQMKAFAGDFGVAFQAIVQATPSVDSFYLFRYHFESDITTLGTV